MSIERDLLIEAKDVLADYWDPSETSMTSKNRKLYYKLTEYLGQLVEELRPDQESFIKSYGNIIAYASEESIRTYFNGARDYETNHIEDCWLLFNAGVGYGSETV